MTDAKRRHYIIASRQRAEQDLRARIAADLRAKMEHWFACEALESAPGDDSRCDCLRGVALSIVEGPTHQPGSRYGGLP